MDLQAWLPVLAGRLGLADVSLDEEAVRLLLDLARDAAHEVERPAAPLTTFLVGMAVGRGASLADASAAATDQLLAPTD